MMWNIWYAARTLQTYLHLVGGQRNHQNVVYVKRASFVARAAVVKATEIYSSILWGEGSPLAHSFISPVGNLLSLYAG